MASSSYTCLYCGQTANSTAPLRADVAAAVQAAAAPHAALGALRVQVGLASSAGQAGRQTLTTEYVAALTSVKVVVTCNPDGWEGDNRLMEALASGALVLADAMVDPPRALAHMQNILFYHNVGDIVPLLKWALSHPQRGDEIAAAGTRAVRTPAMMMDDVLGAVFEAVASRRAGRRDARPMHMYSDSAAPRGRALPLPQDNGRQADLVGSAAPASLRGHRRLSVYVAQPDRIRRSPRAHAPPGNDWMGQFSLGDGLAQSALGLRTDNASKADVVLLPLWNYFLAAGWSTRAFRTTIDAVLRTHTDRNYVVVGLDWSDSPSLLSADPRMEFYFKRSRVNRTNGTLMRYTRPVYPLHYPIKLQWLHALQARRGPRAERVTDVACFFKPSSTHI